MSNLKLYRKRIIPDECVLLKDDRILYSDNEVIVTSWNTLRPKKTLCRGLSCYFPDRGYKVSKFYDHDGALISWYCDIVKCTRGEDEDSYIFTDLLADVVVYPDGFVRVVDMDELASAHEEGLISDEDLHTALKHLDKLLGIIYSGHFDRLCQYIEKYETSPAQGNTDHCQDSPSER